MLAYGDVDVKHKVPLVVVCYFFLNIVLTQFLAFVKPVSGAVAVKAGDWIKYYEYYDVGDQRWVIVKVLDVNDTLLKVNVIQVSISDNIVEANITIVSDINNVIWYSVFPLIIPEKFDLKSLNLTTDKIRAPAWNFTFQTGETVKKYGEETREVLIFNGTYNCAEFEYTAFHKFEYCWDKVTGFLLEIVDTREYLYDTKQGVLPGKPRIHFHLQVYETNLWPKSPKPTLFDTAAKVILLMTFPIVLAHIGRRKMRPTKKEIS